MYNWSVDLKQLKKDKPQYTKWRLEQLVNFGLGNSKLSRKNLKKYWAEFNFDPKKKKYLAMLLWP